MTIASITICSIARPWFGRLALCWLATTTLAYSAKGGQDGEVAPVSATAQLNALLERSGLPPFYQTPGLGGMMISKMSDG